MAPKAAASSLVAMQTGLPGTVVILASDNVNVKILVRRSIGRER
jgi:hypothetical protein